MLPPEKSLREIQEEAKEWSYRNFGNQPSWTQVFGVMEELGELCHAYLKRHQKIRTTEDHDEKIIDAAGDLVIFLINFCNTENLDLQQILNEVWDKVKQRDWKKDSEFGTESGT